MAGENRSALWRDTHARRAARPHWHVDYLRRHTRLETVWCWPGARREHECAAAVSALPGAAVALVGFGSSDCECETHLFWFAEEAREPDSVMLARRPLPPRGLQQR